MICFVYLQVCWHPFLPSRILFPQIFLVKALFSEANPQPIKKAMELLGKCSCSVRAPLTECAPETVETLKGLLKSHNLL